MCFVIHDDNVVGLSTNWFAIDIYTHIYTYITNWFVIYTITYHIYFCFSVYIICLSVNSWKQDNQQETYMAGASNAGWSMVPNTKPVLWYLHKLHDVRICWFSLLWSSHVEQCLTCRRCSIHVFDKRASEWIPPNFA